MTASMRCGTDNLTESSAWLMKPEGGRNSLRLSFSWDEENVGQQLVAQMVGVPWEHNLVPCKTRNTIIAEFALSDNSKPIGIAEYQLAQALPADLEDKLPSIARIEEELEGVLG